MARSAGGEPKLLRARWQSLIESRIYGRRSNRAVSGGKIARRYFVSGIVQGVGFRFFTQRAAENLGVAGYVRNLGDGRVEVYAAGTEEMLDELRSILERGPRGASVSRVSEEITGVQVEYEDGFSVEYDA